RLPRSKPVSSLPRGFAPATHAVSGRYACRVCSVSPWIRLWLSAWSDRFLARPSHEWRIRCEHPRDGTHRALVAAEPSPARGSSRARARLPNGFAHVSSNGIVSKSTMTCPMEQLHVRLLGASFGTMWSSQIYSGFGMLHEART